MKMKHPDSPKAIEVPTDQVSNYESQGWAVLVKPKPRPRPKTKPKPADKPE